MAQSNASDVLDFGSAVSGIFLRGANGRLISLSGFVLARDFSKVAPRMATADLAVLDPFLAETTPSPLVLILHPADRAQSYFLLDSTIAGKRRTMKVFQDTEEIVLNSLENDQLPVIELEDLKKSILISRNKHTPVSLRIRHLALHENLPKSWRAIIRKIFEVNLLPPADKSANLRQHVDVLREEVRSTMFKRYLSKCIWMDAKSGDLGNLAPSESNPESGEFEFKPYISGDVQMFGFIECLAKDENGAYVAMDDQANVYPVPLSGKEWTSPTLHFYDADFRERRDLNEYYSLYRGMEKLCEVGAPVLLHDEDNTNDAIAVRVLRPSSKGGGLVSLSAASFASRNLVWHKED